VTPGLSSSGCRDSCWTGGAALSPGRARVRGGVSRALGVGRSSLIGGPGAWDCRSRRDRLEPAVSGCAIPNLRATDGDMPAVWVVGRTGGLPNRGRASSIRAALALDLTGCELLIADRDIEVAAMRFMYWLKWIFSVITRVNRATSLTYAALICRK
jgi:hypothetical protein